MDLGFSSTETSTGISLEDRILYLPTEEEGRLWGIGFDPKGEVLMLRLDSSRNIEARPDEVELI